MPWFKVDDALAMHVKAFMAGNQPLGLWVRAGSWCMQQLTDGHIPAGVVTALGGTWDDAAALVNAGLWHQAEGGYQFHDWSEYQPTRDQIESERAKTRERVEKHRAAKVGNGGGNAVTNGGRTGAPSRPVPTPTTTYVSESSHVSTARDETDKQAAAEPYRSTLSSQYGINVERVQAHLVEKLGMDLQPPDVVNVAMWILNKVRTPPRAPTSYVLGSITKSPAEVQQYIHESALI